jgi:hypothetical protein
MISAGTTGMTKRCSTVPCSRSRMSGAGEDHGQQRDLIDHLRHCREPRGLQVRIEFDADDQIDGCAFGTRPLPAGEEVLHLVRYRSAEIAGAVTRLRDRRRVDIDLNFGLALREDIGLKVRRNLNHEQEFALVHLRIDLRRRDLHRRLEGGRHQPLSDLPRKFGAVLVDDADGEIGGFGDGAGRDRIDRNAEGVDDQNEHGRVGANAAQLLDHQTKDVADVILERQLPRLGQFRDHWSAR